MYTDFIKLPCYVNWLSDIFWLWLNFIFQNPRILMDCFLLDIFLFWLAFYPSVQLENIIIALDIKCYKLGCISISIITVFLCGLVVERRSVSLKSKNYFGLVNCFVLLIIISMSFLKCKCTLVCYWSILRSYFSRLLLSFTSKLTY